VKGRREAGGCDDEVVELERVGEPLVAERAVALGDQLCRGGGCLGAWDVRVVVGGGSGGGGGGGGCLIGRLPRLKI